MPKYTANIGYGIEFRLSVVIQTVEENHSKEEKWIDDYAVGCDAGEKETYAEWLAEEAARQAQQIIESSVIMRGTDPEEVSICEHGMYSVEVYDEVSDWRELYGNNTSGEIDWSFELPLLATAGSSAEINLENCKSSHPKQAEILYAQADSRVDKIREQIASMLTMNENFPKGWKMLGEFEVDTDHVSVYEHKKWYEMKLDERPDETGRLINRPPPQPTNYRR